nr:Chain C, TAX PEPTIDE Y8A [synthetic construct]
LLFGYPVAV